MQKIQICIDKCVTIHALLVKRDTVGFSQCTFEWMAGCICLCGMEAVTRLLPAGIYVQRGTVKNLHCTSTALRGGADMSTGGAREQKYIVGCRDNLQYCHRIQFIHLHC